jgi:hypothetical protein
MAKNKQVIWVKREAKYFCKWGWTQHRVICPAGAHVILRAQRASKDGCTRCAEQHPSRRAEGGARAT